MGRQFESARQLMAIRRSRLARKEEARSIRQAIFYGGLTVILAFALIFLGIPALIKMAVFLGNLRSSSIPVETKDVIPPSPPRMKPLSEATNSAQINIQGFAEPGSTVKIFLSGITEAETITDNDGLFSYTGINLTLGKNEIYTLATDAAGNTSQESGRLVIFYDDVAPNLEVSEPPDGKEFFGPEGGIKIKGKTEEGATVYINGHLAIVGFEGNFEYPLNLSQGENPIKITAMDKAGNQTEKEIKVNYTL